MMNEQYTKEVKELLNFNWGVITNLKLDILTVHQMIEQKYGIFINLDLNEMNEIITTIVN